MYKKIESSCSFNCDIFYKKFQLSKLFFIRKFLGIPSVMRYGFVILLALGLSVSGFPASQTDTERRCIEGKTYSDGCNSCRCANPSLGLVTCTMMMCSTLDGKTGEMVPYKPQDPPADFWQS